MFYSEGGCAPSSALAEDPEKEKDMEDTTFFLARVFGLYFTIISLFLLIRKDVFVARLSAVLESDAARMVMAIITLIVGILLVVSHNLWVMGWPVLITLFAWLIFIKGILRIFFPTIDEKCIGQLVKDSALYPTAIILLLFGLFFLWVGFF